MYCVVGRDGDCAAADSGRGGASAAARSGDVSRGGAAGGTETAQRWRAIAAGTFSKRERVQVSKSALWSLFYL